jgi:hypothetical protein
MGKSSAAGSAAGAHASESSEILVCQIGLISEFDPNVGISMTIPMNMLTVSEAKTGFSRIAREVIHSRQPVFVRTPHGSVQIAPYELPDVVVPASKSSARRLAREVALGNILGDTL